MKFIILSLFAILFMNINCKSGVTVSKVTARSTFKTNNKDFLNCDMVKQTLIDTDTCLTKGADDPVICEEFTKKMEKELDCKMDCPTFYKKYYELSLETKKKQVEFYKKNKQEDDMKATKFEIEQMKNQKENMIKINCVGDEIIPVEDKKENKKEKK